ncbi:MAG: hypothetical protein H7329_19670 [Opitutaceae bacterium]|nr:hypothetical protein [Cytophagales bacterium]
MARNNALNFNRLSRYNYDFISLEEVIFLEYLIFHFVRKLEIPVQTSRVEQETGLKKHRQQRAIDSLTDKNFIQVEQVQNRRKIQINCEKVALSSQKIFIKDNKSILRFLGQLIVPTVKKEKSSTPISKPKKPAKSASGKPAITQNQINLFE